MNEECSFTPYIYLLYFSYLLNPYIYVLLLLSITYYKAVLLERNFVPSLRVVYVFNLTLRILDYGVCAQKLNILYVLTQITNTCKVCNIEY